MPVWVRRIVICLLGVLGLSHAESLGADPLRASATARGLFIGASIDMPPYRNEPPYPDITKREFNMLVAGNAFKWDALRPSRTSFNFTDTDFLLNDAEANGMAFRGHTLVWHNQLPSWLVNGSFSRDEMIAILREHILTVVGRYRGRILAWDVVNEAIQDGNGQLRNTIWLQRIGPDYIALAFQFAREADPSAILYYNDYEAEGSGTKSDAVFNLVSGLVSQGVPIDGVGWQMHKINPFRIDQSHRTNAQRLANLGLEISITEMDVRIQLPSDAQELQQQALAYADATTFCLTQPNCKALVIWGVTDKYSWIPSTFPGFGDALLWNSSYQEKPAYFAVQQVLEGGPAQPPPAPAGLSAVAGNGQAQLSWNASSGATSYNVKRSPANGGPYATIASPAGTTFTNTGLSNGTTYFYVVSALNANGESPNSNQVSATPQAGNLTLSANPASLGINRGASGTSTIAITRTSFTSSVAFTASGLPSGVTASFNPASTTGASSIVTFTASSTAATGPATVTITGTGGGLTRTTSISLTVNPVQTANFTLAASPAALTVNQGASGTSSIAITRTSFTGAVAFSASGLPAGVTATFNPASTTGNSSTLTLVAAATATLGSATVTVAGTGGGLTRTATIALTVQSGGGTGGVTVTSVVTTSSPWFNEQQLRVSNTANLTALAITVVIQRTTGISLNGQYNTVGSQIQQSNTGNSNAATITYTWTLASGQTLGAATNRTFAAQTGGSGTLHPTSGDTWTVSYTTSGASYTQTGTF